MRCVHLFTNALMRKNRIVLLVIFILLSVAAFRAMGEGESHYSIDQTATVQQSFAQAGSDWSPIIVTEGAASAAIANDALGGATSTSSAATQHCGVGIGAREGLVRYLHSSVTPFERKTDGRWPIASITKLMTALVATDLGMMDKPITLTDAMIATEGDAGKFTAGEVMSGKDVLKGMLLTSSNDAAEAFAQTYGRDAFIRRMNAKAQELRMFDTHYVDPSGLSPMNQSTSEDLYRLADYLYTNHREILDTSRLKTATLVDLHTHHKRTIATINAFAGKTLSATSGRAIFIGGKTGYITEAEGNGNLLSIFTLNNQPFVTIVLGSPDRFGETASLLSCI